MVYTLSATDWCEHDMQAVASRQQVKHMEGTKAAADVRSASSRVQAVCAEEKGASMHILKGRCQL